MRRRLRGVLLAALCLGVSAIVVADETQAPPPCSLKGVCVAADIIGAPVASCVIVNRQKPACVGVIS